MIIRHSLPHTNYTKIDRIVMTNHDLTDGAKVLYAYLCGCINGAQRTDAYIMKAMNLSRASITRRKKELTDAGLILVEQIQPRVYVIYIGHTTIPAKIVKKQWGYEDGGY